MVSVDRLAVSALDLDGPARRRGVTSARRRPGAGSGSAVDAVLARRCRGGSSRIDGPSASALSPRPGPPAVAEGVHVGVRADAGVAEQVPGAAAGVARLEHREAAVAGARLRAGRPAPMPDRPAPTIRTSTCSRHASYLTEYLSTTGVARDEPLEQPAAGARRGWPGPSPGAPRPASAGRSSRGRGRSRCAGRALDVELGVELGGVDVAAEPERLHRAGRATTPAARRPRGSRVTASLWPRNASNVGGSSPSSGSAATVVGQRDR